MLVVLDAPLHQTILLLIQTVNLQELHQLLILLSPHMVVDKVVDMVAKQDDLVHLLVADKMAANVFGADGHKTI